MKIIAVIGGGGGVGTTTIAAHLTAALTAQSQRALAFDLAPANALRLHFGMEWMDETGLASNWLAHRAWHEAAYRSASGVDFVPFGKLARGQLAQLHSALSRQPEWFAQRINELDERADAFAVCDLAAGDEVLRAQVLAHAALAVVVLAPDALSYARAAEAAEQALAEGAGAVALLLNGFDATRGLDRDMVTLLRQDFRDLLLPVVIHRDEAVREAAASSETVFDHAPASRAAYDFEALASVIRARLERQAQAA